MNIQPPQPKFNKKMIPPSVIAGVIFLYLLIKFISHSKFFIAEYLIIGLLFITGVILTGKVKHDDSNRNL